MIDSDKSGKLRKNSITAGLLQLTTAICGIIIPRLILGAYGSDVNGLVNSIAQFLMVVSFMEMGLGAVVQSSLYKPLADNDTQKISEILRSTDRFFRTITIILAIYTLVLFYGYPFLVVDKFDITFTISLILSIALFYMFQYMIGVPERLLLLADQKGYVHYTSQIIALIINACACCVLIKIGFQIQYVKLISALVFLLNPIYLRAYVKKHYSIDRKIKYEKEPIGQKWNGVAQHIAAVVLDQTDVIVLTIFSTLSNVSIYSVYHMVVFGIKSLFLSLAGGVQPLMGEYIAKEEKNKLSTLFDWTEWIMHSGATLFFVITGTLLISFVQVYTKGINDVNYNVPLFAVLITIANAGHCLRLPYNIAILAAGHYKQTQHNYVIAAVLNVMISVLSVKRWGLIGVAIGTCVAMIYQTIWMAYYDSKNIIEYPITKFWKHCMVDVMIAILTAAITMFFKLRRVDYISWIVLAIQKGIICLGVSTTINLLFYRDKLTELWRRMTSRNGSLKNLFMDRNCTR